MYYLIAYAEFTSEVEEVNPKEGGYTLAADMWSLGKLTYTILIGDGISRDEFSQYSQKVAEDFAQGKEYDPNITPRAKKFLRGLLVKDPTLRLTASQALQHSWLRKPLTEGAAIDEACKRISRFWKRREHDDRVIEDLPDRVLALQNERLPSSSGTKPRRRIPDVSPYPYFGLDRYFQQPGPHSTRGPLLDNLKEKDELFVTEKSVAPPKHRHHQNMRVVSVSARDLFGMSQKKVNAGPSSEFENYDDGKEDELSLLPLPTIRDEGKDHYLTYTESSTGARSRKSNGGFQKSHATKRPRTESGKHDESRPRERITEQIPRCSNAKDFGDMVRKMGLS
jgi:serine/threonine protein kinase